MTYTVESGASPARRARRKRAAITLLVVALMLFFAFWYAYSYYRNDDRGGGAGAAPSPTCTVVKSTALPKDTIVNVYNSTNRSGLAGKTATEVTRRGFVVDKVTNDPLKRAVAGTAEVRYGVSGIQQALLVVGLVDGATTRRDARADTSVDLVLGSKFSALRAVDAEASSGC